MAFLIGMIWLVVLSTITYVIFSVILHYNARITVMEAENSITGLPAVKHRGINLSNYRDILFFSGLMIALSAFIQVIEYQQSQPVPLAYQQQDIVVKTDELIDIQLKEQVPAPPKPPKKQTAGIVETKQKDIVDDLKYSDESTATDSLNMDALDLPDNEFAAVEPMNYNVVKNKPAFPGGMNALMQQIVRDYQYPETDRIRGNEGKVFVKFVVDVDGSIRDVAVTGGVNERLDAEAVRVIQNLPQWTPGHNEGHPVPVRMLIPISLSVGGN